MNASVSSKARIGSNVEIGFGAVIGDHVEIGDNCKIGPHAVITGHTIMGCNNIVHAGAVIGNITQALAYKGDDSYLKIGNNNTFRECVTINATEGAGDSTVIGDSNLIMAYAHIAHHCKIGNHVVIANSGTLAGHIIIEDRVTVGGLAAIHQFCKIGRNAMIGGLSKVVKDVIPFVNCDGNPARICGLNTIGLKRSGIDSKDREALKKAYKILFRSGFNTTQAMEKLSELEANQYVSMMINFVRNSSRGIIKERKN